jgi:uncharacterized protein YdcH (DUF465 family)
MASGASETVDIKELLYQSNDEFRKLVQKHSTYSEQLEKLLQKSYLSEAEKIEEVNLKKKKLQLKDQMQTMIQDYRHQMAKSS